MKTNRTALYQPPVAELIGLSFSDVITASGSNDNRTEKDYFVR